jgi:epoxyqueuosine reductase
VRELRDRIRLAASEVGFVKAGFASLAPLPHGDALQRWIEAGMAAEMGFLYRSAALRTDPARLMPGARSAIVVLASYASPSASSSEGDRRCGLVARYARGRDYHLVLRQRLELLAQRIASLVGRPPVYRIVVDTAPLLERELATAAGLGFIGKSTLLIGAGLGSYTVIGTLLVDLALPGDEPTAGGCGRCSLCLDACPTGALVAPYLLDARRCLAYLTIEHRGDIAPPLRDRLAPWVFGCDVCQQVCPHNAAPRALADAELAPPDAGGLELLSLLRLRSGEHRRLVAGRALRRASRPMLRRNAALVAARTLCEGGDLELAAALGALRDEPDPVLREAARWALGQRAWRA